MGRNTVKKMTAIASFGAIAGILYAFLKFSLPFFPSFLEIKFCDVPALIAGFAYGPLVGALVQVVKILLKLLLVGTSTAYVGELSDLVLGIIIVLPASFIYLKKRTLKGAILGMGVSFITHLVFACVINNYIMIPFYIKLFFNGDETILLKVCQAAMPSIKEVGWPLTLAAILPFNALKDIIVLTIVFFVYKPLVKVINSTAKRMHKKEKKVKKIKNQSTKIRKINIIIIN